MNIYEVQIQSKLNRLQGIYEARQFIERKTEEGTDYDTVYRYYKTERDRETLKRLYENILTMKPYWKEEETERQKAVKARARKKSRYRKRIAEMQSCYEVLYFVTLTVKKYKSEKQVKAWGRKYLEENTKDYIGNLDYGKKNERCHIHAIVAWNDIHKKWDKGFMEQQKVYNSKGITAYITKLVNHAGKISAGKIFNKKSGMKEVEMIPF